jgi:hypothetical protein
VVKKVRERFTRIGDRSVRKMAKELNVSHILLQTIVKNDFKTKTKIYGFTEAKSHKILKMLTALF